MTSVSIPSSCITVKDAALILPSVTITIGGATFSARLRQDLAPVSCARLKSLLPYSGEAVHARWSGEAFWSPIAPVWPSGTTLSPESATETPAPGEILLLAGGQSEPELLMVYGLCRFACRIGPLKGNRVLTIDDGLARLAELGHEILWRGAASMTIQSCES
jgi:hypothetical protein